MELPTIMNESETQFEEKERGTAGNGVTRSINSTFITDNPDFDPSKDCPQARGMDTTAGIISNTYKE
jgi:hypothetical protein